LDDVLVYGVVWLGIIVCFTLGLPWAWKAMLLAAIGSLWYLPIGTVISAVILVLLLLPGLRSSVPP
jgi:hypothetical protein